MTLSRRIVLAGSTLLLGVAAFLASADEGKESFSIEGRYETLPEPQPTSDPARVEVVELFWYGCPHCGRFQAYIDPWQESRPEHVDFVRMPAVFQEQWEVHARAYYIALAMDALDKIHAQLFGAIHGQQRRLDTKDSLEEFFVQQGLDGAEFRKHYDSFGVDAGIRRSKVMQARYGIRGVPAVVVNGKYRVSGSLAGSYPNMIKVIDALVEREHKEMLSRN